MGRYWSVIYHKDAPEPAAYAGKKGDPMRDRPDYLDRFVLGFGYGSASNLANTVLAAGAAAPAGTYPDLHLFGRFTEWSPEECVVIARDMRRLFDDTVETEIASRIPWVPEEFEPEREEECEYDILERYFPWGEAVLRVFEEAVARGGSVETD